MRIALSFFLILALAVPALAGGEAVTESLRVGDPVAPFELPTLHGSTFSLAKARSVTDEQALAEVVAAAGGGAITADTSLADVAALGGDAAKVRAMLIEVGRPYGLIPAAGAEEDVETIGDVASWIADCASAPIVFMCWSPMCPTSRGYESRIQEIISATGARFYPLASTTNKRESDEDTAKYVAERKLPYCVLLDRQQKACDILGGRVTPHIFVIDAQNRLAYAGSIDSDPRCQTKSPDERSNWLVDALEALADERPVDVLLTTPKG